MASDLILTFSIINPPQPTESLYRTLNECEKAVTNFTEACTLDLLHKLDKLIKTKLSNVAEHFTFTREYSIEVYLTACCYAVGEFEKNGRGLLIPEKCKFRELDRLPVSLSLRSIPRWLP